MPGRKRKPTRLKVLEGNPGNRKLPENEPQPKEPLFYAPDWFDEEQKAQWAYAINNAPDGVLGSSDRDMLTAWVISSIAFKRAALAQTKLDANAQLPMLTKDTAGNPKQSPYISMMNNQARLMITAASELGFSPASRAKVSVPKAVRYDNPFSKLKDG